MQWVLLAVAAPPKSYPLPGLSLPSWVHSDMPQLKVQGSAFGQERLSPRQGNKRSLLWRRPLGISALQDTACASGWGGGGTAESAPGMVHIPCKSVQTLQSMVYSTQEFLLAKLGGVNHVAEKPPELSPGAALVTFMFCHCTGTTQAAKSHLAKAKGTAH